jgi:hypothetical protein
MWRLRQVVLNEKGLPPESVRISVSWKEGDSAFHGTSPTRPNNLPDEKHRGCEETPRFRTTTREHATEPGTHSDAL